MTAAGSSGSGATAWPRACDLLMGALEGPTRAGIVERVLEGGDPAEALLRLRAEMCAHLFRTPSGLLALKPVVRDLQKRTRREGFRVLHDWDGRAERFNKETIPVDMLDYARHVVAGRGAAERSLAALLDYYVLHVLALLVMRAWDEGDPDENLDRVTALLAALQGPDGSGVRFVGDAETLLWVAISNYHPDDAAYDRLLEKVRALDEGHRMRFALVGAGILGSHLRWGFEAYYNRDLGLLRRDNFADYPWLLFSLATLMEAYDRMAREGSEGAELDDVVGGLLNGITSDVPAFVGEVPAALSAHAEEHAGFVALWRRHRDALLEAFYVQRPAEEGYTPLAFHFNFPHNALKGVMGMTLTGAELPALPLDALVTGPPVLGEEGDAKRRLAEALTEFSRVNPEHIRERRVMQVAYSLKAAHRSFRGVLWTDEEAEAHPAAPDASLPTGRLTRSPFQRGLATEEAAGEARRG